MNFSLVSESMDNAEFLAKGFIVIYCYFFVMEILYVLTRRGSMVRNMFLGPLVNRILLKGQPQVLIKAGC